MFPNFSEIAKTGETLSQQFAQLIALLTEIRDNTQAIREHLEQENE